MWNLRIIIILDDDQTYHFDDPAIPQGHQCERSGGAGMIKIQNNEIEVLDPKMQGEDAEAKNGTLVKKFGKKRNTGSSK